MNSTGNRTQLPLSSASAGCSCCAPAPAPSVPAAVAIDDGVSHNGTERATATPSAAATNAAEFALEGLTCGHCVKSVEEAVSSLAGAERVSVNLVPGGLSLLVVAGSADHAAIRDAVTSAGYSVSSR